MTEPRPDDAIRAGMAASETCEHHWVSAHQGDFPDEVYWVDRCSLCGAYNGARLAEQVAEVAARAVAAEARADEAVAAEDQMLTHLALMTARAESVTAELAEARARVAAVEAQLAAVVSLCEAHKRLSEMNGKPNALIFVDRVLVAAASPPEDLRPKPQAPIDSERYGGQLSPMAPAPAPKDATDG